MERLNKSQEESQLNHLREVIDRPNIPLFVSDTADIYIRVKTITDDYKQTDYSQQISFEKIIQIPFRRQPLSQKQLKFYKLEDTVDISFQAWANQTKNSYLYALPKSYLLKVIGLTQISNPNLLPLIQNEPKSSPENNLLTQTKFALIVTTFPNKYLIQETLVQYIQSISMTDYQTEYLVKALRRSGNDINSNNINAFLESIDIQQADKHSVNFRKIKIPKIRTTNKSKIPNIPQTR